MRFRRRVVSLLVVAMTCLGCASTPQAPTPAPAPPSSALVGETTIVAVAAPAADKCCPNLWEFLGVPQLFRGLGALGNRIRNRLGSRFPGLEGGPPMLAITDPANMSEDASPAAKAAAGAKADEDGAAQDIKAIKYLAGIGCGGCYPDIEDALLEALTDCTEAVRFEAAKAFRDAAGDPCASCKASSCCSPKVRQTLDEIATKRDDQGCFKEPSDRVRRMARVALQGCGGAAPEPTTVPDEGPSANPTPADEQDAQVAASTLYDGADRRVVSATSRVGEAGYDRIPPASATGIVLARVDGEPVYESDLNHQSVQHEELQRIIDCKLLCQEARDQLTPSQLNQMASDQSSPLAKNHKADGDVSAIRPNETVVAAQWIQRRVKVDPTVSHSEFMESYRARRESFRLPAMVQWERIAAPTASFDSREHAYSVISYLRARGLGISPGSPPQFNSESVKVESFDWTSRSDSPSRMLAQLLFSMPVGEISPIVEDASGWYVVRALRRRPSRLMSPEEAREQIVEGIVRQRRARAERAHIQRLRQQAYVWSVLDNPRGEVMAARPVTAELPVRPTEDMIGRHR